MLKGRSMEMRGIKSINLIVIHHTGTDYGATLESIRRAHVEDRGWSDIGYHYLIGPKGTVEVGRPLDFIGAHTACYNLRSVGLAFLGCFDGTEEACGTRPETPAIGAAQRLLLDLWGRIGSWCPILPHRALAYTTCPGVWDVYESLFRPVSVRWLESRR